MYGKYAERVREIAARYAPLVVIASIDEMFLDLSGCERLYARDGDENGDVAIERAVAGTHRWPSTRSSGLPASAGLATSKVMAKVASNLAKPRGVMLVPAGVERAVLAPLPVRSFPGIGPVSEGKLRAAGYETLGAIAEAPLVDCGRSSAPGRLRSCAGCRGRAAARWGASAPPSPSTTRKGETVGSISNERTFREDISDPSSIDAVLCGLCERVCWRARKRGSRRAP